MSGLEIVHTLDEKVWRQFVDQHPQGNVFHTPEMFQVFARTRLHHPELWAAVGCDNQVLALLQPVHIALTDGLLRHLTVRAIAYGSVLYQPSQIGEQALAFLLKSYKHQASGEVLFTELRNLSDLGAAQTVLRECGFIYEEHLNYLISLDQSLEAIMRGIGARTRKNIRRALKRQEVIVKRVAERDQIKSCYGIVQKSYLLAGVPLADWSLFEAALDILHDRGMIAFWLASAGDKDIAASVELLYKDVIYGWYGGVDRTYAEYMPGELLMWHILKWGRENGYKVYDFGGAGKPGERYGVRDFKAKFGGRVVCYGRNLFVPFPMRLEFARFAYPFYRRLMSALRAGNSPTRPIRHKHETYSCRRNTSG